MGAKFFLKRTLCSKRVCNWFIKQDPCEKILFITFPKKISKTKINFPNLVSKVLLWKKVSENKKNWLRKLYLLKWEMISSHLQKFKNSKVLIWVSKTKVGYNLSQLFLCWFDFKIKRLWPSSLQELWNKRFKNYVFKNVPSKTISQRCFPCPF
jgi:hypothetical protein